MIFNRLIYGTSDMNPSTIQQLADDRNIILFKSKFQTSLIESFKSELLQWKKTSAHFSDETPYPEDIRNFHLPIQNTGSERDSIEFDEKKTSLNLYNFRIGDSQETQLKKLLPSSQKILPEILSLHDQINRGRPTLQHGVYFKKNLFFEIIHYPCGLGYFDKHTHVHNFNDGQRYNLILAMSTIGLNYEKGGLFFHINDQDYDLSYLFTTGDLLVCRMDLSHSVSRVESQQASHHLEQNGRWSMGLFYY